jgi:iron(III) transport system permease protein
MFLGNPLLAPLFGTLGLLVLALTVRELPMATQMFKTAISQVDRELEEAAFMSGAPWFHAFRRILLPIVIQTVCAVALVIFITSARDTSSVVLLSGADSRPLSVLMLDYLLESKEYERAAVVGTVLAGGVVSFALLVRFVGYRFGIRI